MKRITKWDDNISASFGDGLDLGIYHDGSNSYINNLTGDLNITVDGDMNVTVKGDVTETFEGNQTTTITKNLDVDAARIDLN